MPIPLPSSRTPQPDGPLEEPVRQVLHEFQLEWASLKVKHLKDVFFSKGGRAALFFPGDLELAAIDDSLYPRRRGMRLSFVLPRARMPRSW